MHTCSSDLKHPIRCGPITTMHTSNVDLKTTDEGPCRARPWESCRIGNHPLHGSHFNRELLSEAVLEWSARRHTNARTP